MQSIMMLKWAIVHNYSWLTFIYALPKIAAVRAAVVPNDDGERVAMVPADCTAQPSTQAAGENKIHDLNNEVWLMRNPQSSSHDAHVQRLLLSLKEMRETGHRAVSRCYCRCWWEPRDGEGWRTKLLRRFRGKGEDYQEINTRTRPPLLTSQGYARVGHVCR